MAEPRTDPEALIAPIVAHSPLIAVVTLEDWRSGPPLARALLAGGVASVEITLRTAAGIEAVRAAAREVEGACVGAGTCLTAGDLEAVVGAGGAFAVSPGLSTPVLRAADDLGLPHLAGVATATEVMAGLEHGRHTFKFFPASSAGGPAGLRALAGPFPNVRFCPTGGVTPDTARDYLALPNVVCLGGSWMAPEAAVREGAWAEITRLSRAAVCSAA